MELLLLFSIISPWCNQTSEVSCIDVEYDCHMFSKYLVFQMKKVVFQSKYLVFHKKCEIPGFLWIIHMSSASVLPTHM